MRRHKRAQKPRASHDTAAWIGAIHLYESIRYGLEGCTKIPPFSILSSLILLDVLSAHGLDVGVRWRCCIPYDDESSSDDDDDDDDDEPPTFSAASSASLTLSTMSFSNPTLILTRCSWTPKPAAHSSSR
jgi:hypothetical protein